MFGLFKQIKLVYWLSEAKLVFQNGIIAKSLSHAGQWGYCPRALNDLSIALRKETKKQQVNEYSKML